MASGSPYATKVAWIRLSIAGSLFPRLLPLILCLESALRHALLREGSVEVSESDLLHRQ
jgi:hypothetical protein